MIFSELCLKFETQETLPIEIEHVCEAICASGLQDDVVLRPEPMDTELLRGVFYQFKRSPGPYAEKELVTLIVYSDKLSLEWQRVVCAKELVHIWDKQAAKTNTPEELTGLLNKLLGPVSSEDFGIADFMAATDKLALYKGLALLFPNAARADALDAIAAGTATHTQIAEWVALPLPLVQLVLSTVWPELRDAIMAA